MGNDSKRLVVTGSSAGGIEALCRLLSALPEDFPAPIVVAQHLDPHVASSLSLIVAKHTKLKVVLVGHREKLEAGTVYIVPSNRSVEIQSGYVVLHADGGARPQPSIDLLFASAAASYGDRLVAVVLTGMGRDGSAGARAVKRNGGTVIIEDPMTAAFPSMPASLSSSMVDVVAPIDRIGAEIQSILSEDATIVDDAQALQELLERVHTTSGIDFSSYKMPTIKRRLIRQLAYAGVTSLREYLDYLERTPGEYERLVANFFIKVTEFFRDEELFAAIKARVLPSIIEEARKGTRELRLWSAGCATGEEAYSLAILLAEVLGSDLQEFNIRIFSTDIDEANVAFARRGIYPPDALVNVPKELVARYFVATDDRYEVDKKIRSLTVFGQHDLGQRAPFPRIDLVLCRNVLIYFDKTLQQRTLELFAFSLRNGGYLALGKAETSNPIPAYYEVLDPGLRIFRRHGDRVVIPPAQIQKIPSRATSGERARGTPVSYESARELRRTANEWIGTFLMQSSIGFVAVDKHYDISAINAAARELLHINGVAIGEDFVHLLPASSSSQLREILDAALRSEEPQMGGKEIEVPGDTDRSKRFVTVSAYPSGDASDGDTSVVLLVVDVTDLVERRHDSETRAKQQEDEVRVLREAQVESRERHRALLEANRQLTEANSEFRARSDALMIDAEEAAAATEEIETLNEEMQATNEELETLNEEFQATIEELNTTNDELEARSIELQDLVVTGETQRQTTQQAAMALQAMADAIEAPMAVVHANAEIVASNDGFRALQHSSPENAIQITDDAGGTIPLSVLLRRAATGEEFSFTYQVIDATQSRTSYRGCVVPLAGEPAGAGGLIKFEKTG